MTTSLTIREEAIGDEPSIRAVHLASFPSDAEARLVEALRAAGRLTLSLVAVLEEQVVGHVAFSPVTCEGFPIGLGLAPVAVAPERRRQGVAAELIRRGLERCRGTSGRVVVVLGEPHYYRRFGFEPASRWGLKDEYGGGEAFQALELAAGELAPGVVRYAPEFAIFG